MASPTGGLTRIAINVSSSGDNLVVAGVTGVSIGVREFCLVPAAAVSLTVKSGTSTSLSGGIPIGGTSGAPAALAGGYNPQDHFVTNSGDGLNLYLSSGVAVTGWLIYVTY